MVVVTIAVLVLGLGWWFWPRVDQRFVGKWKTSNGSKFELQSNGIADSFYAHSGGLGMGVPDRVNWRVSEGRFRVFQHDRTFKNQALNCYYRWKRGEQILEARPHFEAEVVEVTGDHFVLRKGPRDYRFERVSP